MRSSGCVPDVEECQSRLRKSTQTGSPKRMMGMLVNDGWRVKEKTKQRVVSIQYELPLPLFPPGIKPSDSSGTGISGDFPAITLPDS